MYKDIKLNEQKTRVALECSTPFAGMRSIPTYIKNEQIVCSKCSITLCKEKYYRNSPILFFFLTSWNFTVLKYKNEGQEAFS